MPPELITQRVALNQVGFCVAAGAKEWFPDKIRVEEAVDPEPVITDEGPFPAYDVVVTQFAPGVNNIVKNRYRLTLEWIGQDE